MFGCYTPSVGVLRCAHPFMGVPTLEMETSRLSRGEIPLAAFVKEYGEPYSGLLGIDLAGGRSKEIVKWFLAAILYSKPIREFFSNQNVQVL